MDKVLDIFHYGICVFSLDTLQVFLKKEKIMAQHKMGKVLQNPNFHCILFC